MRNKEVAEAIRQMEANFKLHSESQLATYTKIMEQYMAAMDPRMGQMNLKLQEVTAEREETEKSDQSGGGSSLKGGETGSELSTYLRGFKFDLPKFNGEDVHNSIYKIEKYFSLYSVAPTVRLQVVAFHLEGEAAAWYQWMDRNGALGNWDRLLEEMKSRFGKDPLGKISKLVQTGPVSQYRADFEGLMNRIVGVGEHMFLNFYIWGLKPEIRRELLIAPSKTFMEEAMTKAQLFEERNDDHRGMVRREESHAAPVALQMFLTAKTTVHDFTHNH